MNRILSLCLVVSACAAVSRAQDVTHEQYQLADERQLWSESRNAAGLAFDMRDSSDSRGVALVGLLHRSGDYHRVQDGAQQNLLRFFTERYQKIGRHLYGYGSFDFDMGRTKQRAFSDVLRPYNSDPFISGSSQPGKYDTQDFTLNARLATDRMGHFNYGAALYYKVGDLSRLRDPRSRVRTADYRLTPSLAYTAGRHTAGLAAWYQRYKEKLTGLTTVQTDPTLKYYTMTGLEHATGKVGDYASYWREYVNHDFGAELSYAFQGDRLRSLTSLSLSHGTEYVYGQYKYEPGRWYTYNYGMTTRNRIGRGRVLHSIDASLGYEQGYADQYASQQVTERDGAYTTQRWERTMTFKKRYQLKKLDASLHYRLSLTDGDALRGYAGASYALQSVSNKHLLATSTLEYASSHVALEGGYGLLGHRLWATANAGYRVSHKAAIALSDATTDYAVGVLLPDMPLLAADYWQGRLELTWQQPLRIKRQPTQWFAKLYGSYLRTNNGLHSQTAGLTVGLYY